MTKQDILKAIENGEDVWCIIRNCIQTIELNEETCGVSNDEWLIKNYHHPDMFKPEYLCKISKIFKTKAEAEHHLHHANVTRTETLPFLTWEEFLKEYSFDFYCGNHEWFTLYWNDVDGIVIESIDGFYKKTWDLIEVNFYKAYDECVKLFRGDEE